MTKRACRGMGKDYHRGYGLSKNKSVPFFVGVDDQMDMVGHEAIRINLAAKPGFPFLKCVEIKEVVVVTGKNDLTIMPPLNDMVGEVGDD